MTVMTEPIAPGIVRRAVAVTGLLFALLLVTLVLGLSLGSSDTSVLAAVRSLMHEGGDGELLSAIVWRIRLPRVLLAAAVGAALSVGGLVFQALLRNPLAEPYILGLSGGAAIGAICGILMGLARFPGVGLLAFLGSCATLLLVLVFSGGRGMQGGASLLLSGVMINSFCSAIIMFLVSLTQDARLHNIIFWLMGDLGRGDLFQVGILAAVLLPCFGVVFWYANVMNVLLMGRELALTTGVDIRKVTVILLGVTSLMVSATVSQCGLIGFVGLVVPHVFRLILGSDHRVLLPACMLGGGAYMVLCDLLARTLPKQGEMPAGVITAMIGAPLFIMLLKRTK